MKLNLTELNRAMESVCLYQYDIRLQQQLELTLRGPVAPNAELLLLSGKKFRSERNVLQLATASWWLGSIGALIRVNLEQYNLHRLTEENQITLGAILSSKAAAQEILLSTLSERDFFGNYLPTLRNLLESLHWTQKLPQRARRKVRRRGYRDHGSARPSHRWEPKHDWSITELQNSIEARRRTTSDVTNFLRGFLE